MIEGLSRSRHPLEKFVAMTLDAMYQDSFVVVQPGVIENRKGRTEPDLNFQIKGYPTCVLLEVTQSPMNRVEPKHRQERVLNVAAREQADYESAILFKQHFVSPSVVIMSMQIIRGLAVGTIRTRSARDELKHILGHARCRENMTNFAMNEVYLSQLYALVIDSASQY